MSTKLIPSWIISLLLASSALGLLFPGMLKVYAWFSLVLLVPAVALLVFVVLIVNAIWKRNILKSHSLINIAVSLIGLLPILVFLRIIPLAYPSNPQSLEPGAMIRVPTDSVMKVGSGGPTSATNDHAGFTLQRWAYDLFVAPYYVGSSNLDDYGCYGTPVVAPIAGDVVLAVDGIQDMTPGQRNFATPRGNHVAIKLPSDTYLLILHLKEGSLTVKEGDHVEEGQVIAQCGNSGATGEPHIHIQHQRQHPSGSDLFGEGLPLYFRDHDGPAMPVGGYREENGTMVLTGDTISHLPR